MAHLTTDASRSLADPLTDPVSRDNLSASRGILLGLGISGCLWIAIAYALRAAFF